MGFLNDLGKGFIRSAVNQVGRDTGKVISNTIYGDAHATPIRNVGISSSGTYFDTTTSQQLAPEQLLQYAASDGWTPEHSAYTWPQRCSLMFFAILIGILPMIFPMCLVIPLVPIYIIYRGVKQMRKTQTIYTKTVFVPAFKADKRYKGGIRPDGTIETKASILLNSTEEDKAIHTRIGWSYIACAVGLWLVVFFIGTWMMETVTESQTLRNYERVLEDSTYTRDKIERDFYWDKDTAKYSKSMDEYRKSIIEATEYINSHKK